MSTLTKLLADASTRERNRIAEFLGYFPVDHPIREHLRDYPDQLANIQGVIPCATAGDAVRKVRSSTINDPTPGQLAVVDAIREEIDGPQDGPTAVASNRLARDVAAVQRGDHLRRRRRF